MKIKYQNHSQQLSKPKVDNGGTAHLSNVTNADKNIQERIRKKIMKEICDGYDISESKLKAEMIIDIENLIDITIQETIEEVIYIELEELLEKLK